MDEFPTSIKINDRLIGQNHRPFIIAEMSGNHKNSLDRALELVEAAAQSGADALKIQTYTADTMTLNSKKPGFIIDDANSLWNGRSLYDLYEEASTPWDWHKPIFNRAQELGLIAFSSPFDATAVDFLEELEVPLFKIASFESVDTPLIKKVASLGKPVIVSTGMSKVSEIGHAVSTLRENGSNDIVLLKCTSSYPADPIDSNTRTISHLKDLFGTHVGLSDHTMGVGAACASVAFGASVIEKHFTLSRSDGGVDSAFSLEPHELKLLVTETHRAYQSLGRVRYGTQESENNSMMFRRSIYITEDIKKGEAFNEKNIRTIRPGFGLGPKFYETFLGKKANQDIAKGSPLSWDHIG